MNIFVIWLDMTNSSHLAPVSRLVKVPVSWLEDGAIMLKVLSKIKPVLFV